MKNFLGKGNFFHFPDIQVEMTLAEMIAAHEPPLEKASKAVHEELKRTDCKSILLI